jgi:hypothetical protein
MSSDEIMFYIFDICEVDPPQSLGRGTETSVSIAFVWLP